MDWTVVKWGTLGGLVCALLTLAGALPVLFNRKAAQDRQDVMLGFAAGVMMTASYLSLVVPAVGFARASGFGSWGSALQVSLAVLAGAVSLELLRRSEPLSRARIPNQAPEHLQRSVWLLIVGMTGHNLPEGAAVGVAFGAGDLKLGLSTAIGIGVQDIPEGLAVAAAVMSLGVRARTAVLIAGLTGLVEPIGAFLGAAVVSLISGLLPFGMGWAAGAMLYIVAAELIPAMHSNGGRSHALGAFVIGLTAMLLLDVALS